MLQFLTRKGQAGTSARRTDLLGQLSAPLRHFLHTESGGAGILLAATVLALVWANSPWSAAYVGLLHTHLSVSVGGAVLAMSVQHAVNDGLMVLFFFVIGLEVRREFSVGELTDRSRAVVPMIAALGGMALPALLYLLFNPSGPQAVGWGVVIGTDTAFMLGALALVGPRFSTQLRVFLLTLTVIDDFVAVTVIGVAYSDGVALGPLLVAVAGLCVIALLSRFGAWRAAPYLLLLLGIWLATLESGLHPSIAGMAAGLLVAAREPKRSDVEGAARLVRAFRQSPMAEVGDVARRGLARAISVNERLQTSLHPWSSYLVVPVFAFANAGIDLRGGVLADALGSPLTWGVVIGLVVGKFVGIGASALVSVRLGAGSLPQGVRSGHVLGGAGLSGIGFTVSLLIAGLAFDDSAMRDQATVGVLLAAVLATLLGWAVFAIAARFGQRDADLPQHLSTDVDAARDHVHGAPDAALTLVEYVDFECPFCSRTTGVTQELCREFGDRLRYVVRHLPLPDVHPHAEQASRAAEAAARQDRFWEMHDLLFARQDELEYEDLVGYAHELDLDVEQFMRDLDNPEVARRIREDVASAEASGAKTTPTFYVNGRRHRGPHDAQSLRVALEQTADPSRSASKEFPAE
ncbi:Na+/H+ antiporter NhaA [Propionicicella superfundia]|uniref:Na+/H+ antiporter NhaA n=1 Tax=Propionicicella superfundia TaxID=348582 RepID=UPI00041732FE|nr:Na+/H+ antiporter NhaA [Propionicicella superfundia]